MKAARRTREESRLTWILEAGVAPRVNILRTRHARERRFPCNFRVNKL